MSNPPDHPPFLVRQEKTRRSPWLVFSVLLHLLGAAALIFFTPVGDRLIEQSADRRSSKRQLTEQRVEEFARFMEQARIRQLREELGRLEEMRKDMRRIHQQTRPETEPQSTPAVAEEFESGPPEVSRLYRKARLLEEAMAEEYREIRIYELVRIRQIPTDQAEDLVEVPSPPRSVIDPASLDAAPPRNAAELKAYKETLSAVGREVDAMLVHADAMLAAARRTVADEHSGTALALARRFHRLQAFDEAATEDAGVRAVDLTGMMTADAEPGGSSQRPGVQPKIKNVDVGRALPARTFGPAGARSEWLFIDGWYLLGPFPNPGRANIDKEFPPESVIDLSATYTGDGGRPIQWRYFKSASPRVTPPGGGEYTIWYAWTEVRFEEATDIWIATGSDDSSNIWINDQKVWTSVDRVKGWRPGEGFRRVHFLAGRNTILYRLENGMAGLGFSLMLKTTDPDA